MKNKVVKLMLSGNHTIYLHEKTEAEAIELRGKIVDEVRKSLDRNQISLIEIGYLVFGTHMFVAVDVDEDTLSLQERYLKMQEKACEIMENETRAGEEWKSDDDV